MTPEEKEEAKMKKAEAAAKKREDRKRKNDRAMQSYAIITENLGFGEAGDGGGGSSSSSGGLRPVRGAAKKAKEATAAAAAAEEDSESDSGLSPMQDAQLDQLQELKGDMLILQKKHDEQVHIITGLEHANTKLQQQVDELQQQNGFFQTQNHALQQAHIQSEEIIESQRIEIIGLLEELEKLKGLTTQMNTMSIEDEMAS